MNAVVDTNVVAYYILGTEPFRAECSRFWHRVQDAVAPASWEAEITNVLWLAARSEVLELPEALHRLELVKALGVRSIPLPSLLQSALVRASLTNVAVYDTLFVELAERESLPLVTFDGAVLETFPQIARRPAEINA